MEPTQPNSPDTLCAEILAEAGRESQEIRRKAELEASTLLAAAAAEAEKIRRETIEQARTKAKRRKEVILETITVEKRRMRSARVEASLESLREEIRRRLAAQNSDGRETVVALALEAVGQMPANDLVVKISAGDQAAFGNGLAEEIIRRAQRPQLHLAISTDAAMTGGDVAVQNAGGSQFWDNRLRSRLERLWPELRRQMAIAGGLITESNANGENV
jgi:vacuolar-type H+-ATPase subunit E/Vma4